jgi:ribosomal protein L40E/osmotically-inducible protein OsmY
MICPNCKIIVPDSAEFCQRCQTPVNEHLFEKSTRRERLKEMLICPKCGALHTPTAKFCRNDGTPLSKGNAEHIDEPITDTGSKKRFSLINLIIFFILLILMLSLSYMFFWTKSDIKDLSEIHSEKAINNISEIKDPQANAEKSSNFAIIEVEINRALRKSGIKNIYVEVDNDFKATITGYFNKKREKQKAFNIIESYKEITKIDDYTNRNFQIPKINANKLKEEIDKALKDRGINKVIVEVDDFLNVTLKGTVKSADEKRKVFEVTDLYKEIRKVKDLVFVVEH